MAEQQDLLPIIVPPGQSAAGASRPDQPLDERHLTYDHNPVPWWLSLVWISFLVLGSIYLIVNLSAE